MAFEIDGGPILEAESSARFRRSSHAGLQMFPVEYSFTGGVQEGSMPVI